MSTDYDLLVIGTGPGRAEGGDPGGEARQTVAVVERGTMVGGVSVNTGTIPSKTLREAILYLTGLEPARDLRAELPREGRHHDGRPSPADASEVIEREIDVIRDQLKRNHVHVVHGNARFLDPHTVARCRATTSALVRGEHRDRHRDSARAPPGRWRSTTARSSTPTGCCSWTESRARWSSSGPA